MGSPLSPILADIVLESVIERALRDLPFKIPFLRKYVDDLFAIIPKDALQTVLDVFNKQEIRLQFTAETEENAKLPYLDTTVIRNDDRTLCTTWYIKPIASGRMLNYNSFHQYKQKINAATNLIHRVSMLTTDEQAQQETNAIIHRQLSANNYPKTLINRLINMYKNKRVTSSDQPPTTSPPTVQLPPPSPPTVQHQLIDQPPPTDHRTNDPLTTHPPADHLPAHQPPADHLPARQPPADHLPAPHPSPPVVQHDATNLPSTSTHHNAPQSGQSSPTDPASNDSPSRNEASTSHPTTTAPALITIPNPLESTPNFTYRSIPYVTGLTERISKLLSKDYPQVKIAARQHNTVDKFHSKVKDPKNKKDMNNVIYSMPCNNCTCCYIGMTQNKLSQRLSGHQSHINKLDTLLTTTTNNNEQQIHELSQKTAMIEHCITHKHKFNLEKTSIKDHSNNPHTLTFLEMCHIYNNPNTVNRRTDIENLNTAYAAILQTLQQ